MVRCDLRWALVNRPEGHGSLILDEDTFAGHHGINVRRRVRNLDPRQFRISLVTGLEGDEFGGGRQRGQNRASVAIDSAPLRLILRQAATRRHQHHNSRNSDDRSIHVFHGNSFDNWLAKIAGPDVST